jgi:hypothetical protein
LGVRCNSNVSSPHGAVFSIAFGTSEADRLLQALYLYVCCRLLHTTRLTGTYQRTLTLLGVASANSS